MSNFSGESYLQAGDRKYQLRCDFRALIEIERAFDESIFNMADMDFTALGLGGLNEILSILLVGDPFDESNKDSPQSAGDLILAGGIAHALEAVTECLTNTFTPNSLREKLAEQKAQEAPGKQSRKSTAEIV